MRADQIEAWRAQRLDHLSKRYKLDRPMLERIMYRAVNTVTFNFGRSTVIKSAKGEQEVLPILMEALPRTMLLFTTALVFQLVIGFTLGLKKAQKPGGSLDKGTSFVTMIIYGMPSWWLGMMLILFFVYFIKLFPSGGLNSVPSPQGIMFLFDRLWHMALPVLIVMSAIFKPSIWIIIASLSLLGLGDPTIITWGQILHDAQSSGATLNGLWWWIVQPGLFIAIMGMTFAFLGLAMDKILHPKLRTR